MTEERHFANARDALLNLVAESKIWQIGDFEHVTDLLIKELWLRGFKLIRIDEQKVGTDASDTR